MFFDKCIVRHQKVYFNFVPSGTADWNIASTGGGVAELGRSSNLIDSSTIDFLGTFSVTQLGDFDINFNFQDSPNPTLSPEGFFLHAIERFLDTRHGFLNQ